MAASRRANSPSMVVSLALLLAILWVGGNVGAQEVGESVTIRSPVERDLYLAGRDLRVTARVDGDLVAAGRSLTVEAPIGGDIIAAGDSISLLADVADDVRAAGSTVRVAGAVAGHLVAAGEQVIVDGAASVGDWAWLAGARVEIGGSVGELKAGGREVIITGEVRGDAELAGGRLEIGPDAVIEGDLTWRSATEPRISEQARIDGQIVRKPLPEGPDAGWVGVASAFGTLLASVVGASVLRLLFPHFVPAAAETARVRWPQSLGLGLAAIVLLPVTAVVLLITGVGWMLGLMLLLLYVASLLAGGLLGLYAAGAIGTAVSGRSAPSLAGQIVAVALAAVALLVISWIPLLGPLSVFAVLLLGLGSLLLEGLRRYRGGGATAA